MLTRCLFKYGPGKRSRVLMQILCIFKPVKGFIARSGNDPPLSGNDPQSRTEILKSLLPQSPLCLFSLFQRSISCHFLSNFFSSQIMVPLPPQLSLFSNFINALPFIPSISPVLQLLKAWSSAISTFPESLKTSFCLKNYVKMPLLNIWIGHHAGSQPHHHILDATRIPFEEYDWK